MVEAAVTDVVSPAVAAEDPNRLLDEAVRSVLDCAEHFLELALSSLDSRGKSGFDCGCGFLRAVRRIFVCFPIVESGFHFVRAAKLDCLVCVAYEFGDSRLIAEVHAVAEFRVVLKERVCPCGTVTRFVCRVRAGGSASAVDRRTARSVCDDHAIAEELGDELDVRRLAAARARTAEFEQRTHELAALYRRGLELVGNVYYRLFSRKFPILLFRSNRRIEVDHLERLVLRRADVCTARAARAVERRNLNTEREVFESLRLKRNEVLGNFLALFDENGADASVRADERALVALYAVFGDPLRNACRYAALFELGRARGYAAVRVECGDGKGSALLRYYGLNERIEVFVLRRFDSLSARSRVCPRFGIFDFDKPCNCIVYSVAVHLYDVVALFAVRLLDHLLHVFGSFVVLHDVRELEESRLHYAVYALSEPYAFCDLERVYRVELQVFFRYILLHRSGKLGVHLLGRPLAVEKEYAAVLDLARHVVASYIGGVVASDKVRKVDKVSRLNGGLAEAKVRNGYAARLFRVVLEVALRVHIRVVADYLYTVLVCADRAVRAEAVELAAYRALGSGVYRVNYLERCVRYVVVYADREMVFRLSLFEVFVNRTYHRRVKLFRAETVSAADDGYARSAAFGKSGNDVEVERFAQRACFLGSVEHCDLLDGRRDRADKIFRAERTVKANLQKSDFFAVFIEVVKRLFGSFAARAHHDDDLFRVGRADVLIQFVLSSRKSRYLFHHRFDDLGYGFVILVCGFAVLEVDVAVLSRAHLLRMLGI